MPRILALLQVGRDEDVSFQPGRGAVGGNAVGQIAGRGTADRAEAELAGLAQRHGNHAILERQRREIDGIVLDPQLFDAERIGEAIGPDQRRAADLRTDRRFAVEGQQFAVAPHVRGRFSILSRLIAWATACVIVIDLERAEVVGTEIEWLLGVEFAAHPTTQANREI